MIAESVTNQSYNELLHSYILDPLQLDSTYLGVYDTADVVLAQPWQNEINTINLPRISILSEAWSAGALVGGGLCCGRPNKFGDLVSEVH
jgi:CubicO group peptidase (beta-lactamase class C family)